jgi:hypothetical protein
MTVRREALTLVALVVVVDAAFVGAYFLAGIQHAGSGAKLAFTVAWTVVTLLVVLRGLTRIRLLRSRRAGAPGS